jgi:UDP-N-acetylglucosamine 2-epimerase
VTARSESLMGSVRLKNELGHVVDAMLMMKAVRSSVTSKLQIQEVGIIHIHRRENLKYFANMSEDFSVI